ncbi:MAG: lipoprotein [Oscillospiraceae bacterium]
MKKILCTLLASAMLLGITACGTTDAPEEREEKHTSSKQDKDNDDKEAVTVTSDDPAAPAESSETDPAPEVEQPPKELPVINDYTMVDGCMIFTANGTDYIYNIAENKMYPTELTKIEGRVIKSIRGKVVIIADENGYDPEYYNLETGEFIGKVYSTENPYLGEYNPIYTREESFDGVVYSFGVFNSQAEWVVPLSNEYSICKTDLSKVTMYSSDSICMHMISGYFDGKSLHYYDFINDKYIDITGTPYFFSGDKFLYEGSNNLCVCDITTGTSTDAVTNVRITNYQWTTDGGFFFQNEKDGSWIYVDSECNITDIPLSEYDITRFKDVTRDYFAFIAKNPAGTGYVIITDSNGNRVTEPLDGGASVKISGDYALIAIKTDGKMNRYVLNLKTGEQTPIDKENFGAYDEASGKMILKKDGACYLATLDDPNTLINPFAICE